MILLVKIEVSNIGIYNAIHCPRLVKNKRAKRNSGGISMFDRSKYNNGIVIMKQDNRGIL